MIVLGIETSTAVCSVGLYGDGGKDAERSLIESHIHSEKLLTLVQQVLVDGKVSLHEIDAVAVSQGPGSFTGLRIGLSTAKGLSYSLERPLIAVPTLEAITEAFWLADASVRQVVVLIDAKQGEFYAGRYDVNDAGAVQPMDDVRVLSLEAAVAAIPSEGDVLVATDALAQVQPVVREGVTLQDIHPACRGVVVARIGYRKMARKEIADVAMLEPLYLKDFIVKTAEHMNKNTMVGGS